MQYILYCVCVRGPVVLLTVRVGRVCDWRKDLHAIFCVRVMWARMHVLGCSVEIWVDEIILKCMSAKILMFCVLCARARVTGGSVYHVCLETGDQWFCDLKEGSYMHKAIFWRACMC